MMYSDQALFKSPKGSVSERENRRLPRGSEHQTKKNELARMGIEPMTFGLISAPKAMARVRSLSGLTHYFLGLIFTASRVSAILSLSFLLFPALSPFQREVCFQEAARDLLPISRPANIE